MVIIIVIIVIIEAVKKMAVTIYYLTYGDNCR